jgi:glycosyltransferase involved in cell wall biosynthesis
MSESSSVNRPALKSGARPQVLLLNRWFDPEVFGGTETTLRGLGDALVDAGVDVSVVCEGRLVPPGTSTLGSLRVHRYKGRTPAPRFWFAQTTANYLHLARSLRDLGPAVPHRFVIARMAEHAAAASRAFPGARVTYWAPGSNPDWFGLYAGRDSLTLRDRMWNTVDRLQNLAIQRRAVHRSQLEVAESEHVRNDIVHRYGVSPDRVAVRENGVDLKRFSPGNIDGPLPHELRVPNGTPIVAAVGRLEPMKNFTLLLRAFAKMEHRQAHLAIVGDGGERTNLENDARALGISERVHFLGWRRDVERFLACATAFVLPSRYEPYGNAFVEALASGVPTIGLMNDGNVFSAAQHHVRDGVNGYLIEAGDHTTLAARLDLLVTTRRVRDSLGARARAMAIERYDWNRLAMDFLHDFGF